MNRLLEQILLEQPHVNLDMDDPYEENIWDFCAEDRPKTWIVQLVNLYALKKLVSLNKKKNKSLVMFLTKEEVDEFTESMIKDPFFLSQARACIRDLKRQGSEKILRIMDKYLPNELKEKIGIEQIGEV